MMTKFLPAVLVVLSTAACIEPDDDGADADIDADVTYKLGVNKLGVNKLGVNKLGVNKLGVNKLGVNSLETTAMMANPDSREVYSYVVGCALPAGTTITARDANGVSYSFAGLLGLAPAWATRAPTAAEKRWVSACLLSRTNLYGVQVSISMRHDTNPALVTTSAEASYTSVEGAFYGDLFASTQTWYACGNRAWSPATPNSLRMCALSGDGVVTDCNFTYTGRCTDACLDKTPPFNTCLGGATRYNEVITINLLPSQVQ